MGMIIAVTSLFISSNAIVIVPTTNDPYASVSLAPDPRGINRITPDNQWEIYQAWTNELHDWGLKLTLDAAKYSFSGGSADSVLSISINGSRGSDQCDAYFAFSIGDNQYLTFVTDLDGYYHYSPSSGEGLFIFPECESSSIESGNPSNLIPEQDFDKPDMVNALAGGNSTNWYRLTSRANGNKFPLTFEFINNNNDGTFTFRFLSPKFSENESLKCTYNSSVDSGEDFKLYISPDGGKETIYIESIAVNGTNVGFTDNPTSLPTSSEPTTGNPTTTKPTTAKPTTSNPTTSNPTTSNPTTYNPTTSNPTTSKPTTDSPTTGNPTTANPTTSNPTTSVPTTFNPTTSNPTTDNPTSAGPTTFEPTTAKPTTRAPTTTVPTTNNPTTDNPTTPNPTTDNPTTSDPTAKPSYAPTGEPTADPTTTLMPTATPITFDPTTDPTLDGCDFDIDTYLEKCYCQSPYDFDAAKIEQEIEIVEDLRSSESSCEEFRDEIITTMKDNNTTMKVMMFVLFGMLVVSVSINICIGMLLLRKRDTKGYDAENTTFGIQNFDFKNGEDIEESDSEINVKATHYDNDGQN